MSVPDFDDLAELKAKLDEHGYQNCGINHGFCYSLYVCDPNGMLVEFVGDAVNELEINEAAAASAHQELTKWNSKGLLAQQFGARNHQLPSRHLAGRNHFEGDARPLERFPWVPIAHSRESSPRTGTLLLAWCPPKSRWTPSSFGSVLTVPSILGEALPRVDRCSAMGQG
jgi:hypothetical protein